MSAQYRPISPVLGAEVSGVDLREELDESLKASLREAWHRSALLLFRDQPGLSDEQIDRVASIFGEISDEGGYPKYISNVIPNLTPLGELLFHMDFSWSPSPLRGLLLYAYEVPPPGTGGETLFANAKLAFDTLPSALRARIEGHTIEHATANVRTDRPRVSSQFPIAFPHPVTGERVLYCSPRHFSAVLGLEAAEGKALCDDLAAHLYRPEHIYTHSWRPGDLAVWDNLKLQHARTAWDPKHRRHLRRIQIAAPVAAAV
jgi:alpha-ketoglutarate-dependent taurine dioxygenase